MKQRITAVFLFALMAGVLFFWREVSAAVLHAGERCVRIVIPSLYCFSILAALCVKSGILERMAGILAPVCRRIHVDAVLVTVLLFSQIGGYPVGAQLLHQLCENGRITKEQEASLLCVCLCSGPAFALGTVCSCGGISSTVGWMLLASILLPNLVYGLLLLRRQPLSRMNRTALRLNAQCLTDSVMNGAGAMVKISAMILFFAAAMAVVRSAAEMLLAEGRLPALPFPEVMWKSWASCTLEISTLPAFLAAGGSLPMAAALLSFGGICVHCQVAAICEGNLYWGSFLAVRVVLAAVSFGLCSFLLDLCPGIAPASLTIAEPVKAGGTYTPAVWCLLLMTGMLLARHNRLCREGILKKDDNGY